MENIGQKIHKDFSHSQTEFSLFDGSRKIRESKDPRDMLKTTNDNTQFSFPMLPEHYFKECIILPIEYLSTWLSVKTLHFCRRRGDNNPHGTLRRCIEPKISLIEEYLNQCVERYKCKHTVVSHTQPLVFDDDIFVCYIVEK